MPVVLIDNKARTLRQYCVNTVVVSLLGCHFDKNICYVYGMKCT